MTLRNQISAAAGIPQKRSTAISRKPMIRHPHSRDSVSVGFRTAGHPARQVARDLDIHESLLRRWQRKLAARQARAPGVKPSATVAAAIIVEQEEIRKLKRENERLRMERDVLKKAIAIFTETQR